MPTLTEQLDNLNKRVGALENSELIESEAVPNIVKMYANIVAGEPSYCSESIFCSESTYCSDSVSGVIDQLINAMQFGAVGTGIVPDIGNVGLPNEVLRKPMSNITVLDNEILLSVYFDEQDANGYTLTNAAMFYAPESAETVIVATALNLEKTSSKTLTLSAEITVTEV